MPSLSVDIPGLRVQSEMNLREHWAEINKRKQSHKDAVWSALLCGHDYRDFAHGPVRVTMTRLFPPRGKEMDTDNLASAFKFIRDALAAWMKRSDAPGSGVEWVTAQERADEWGVRIEITA